MKKFLTVLLSSTFLLNTLNAEEMPVLENDNEVKAVVEENTQVDETTTQNEDTTNEEQEVKNYVAQINDTKYETFDEAYAASKNDDTIILLSNATTEGINLKHNLTIDGKKYTLTFTNKGIAMWKYSLTFKNMTVSMNGITSTPYTAEWNWMAIASSADAKLILENTNMAIDAAGKSKNNTHAIYFCGNNVLSLKNSTLTIKNYKQDALEWNGGNGGYNILLDNSSYLSDNNRSGFTGSFTVKTINNSKIDVINSTGNGSNGSHFEFYDSKVNFNNNGGHGLSAGKLKAYNTTINAINNKFYGVVAVSELLFDKNANVTINENGSGYTGGGLKFSISKYTGKFNATIEAGANVTFNKNYRNAIENYGIMTFENGSNLSITENNEPKKGAGIYNAGTITLPENAIIMNNFANEGGGIYNKGTMIIPASVKIYNNHAEVSSDDIYNDENANITFSNTHDDWELNGGYKDKDKTEKDCTDKIDGWYDDNEEKRYNSHDENRDNLYVLEKASGNYTNKLTLKAAHGLYGNVTVKYIDDEGKELSENIILRGKVDSEYTSLEKEFEYYELIEVKGNKTGKYTLDNQEVIYIYSFVGGMGGDIIDPNFPKTGVEDSNLPEVIFSLSSLLLAGTILLKKRFN